MSESNLKMCPTSWAHCFVKGQKRRSFEIVSVGKLDLWTAAEQSARDAGAGDVERLNLCTRCRPDLFFSERRTGRPRGTQGVLGLVR